MKYTSDNARAAALLSESYRPGSIPSYSEEEHHSLLTGLRTLLMEKATKAGLTAEDVGELSYYDNGGELAFRGELLHWGLLVDGMLLDFSVFLKERAPNHIIILTFDFQDVAERFLESPTIIVFPTEIVGGFDLCDLDDTPRLLGFHQ